MINQNNKLRFDGTKAMREARKVTVDEDKKKGRIDYERVDSTLDDRGEIDDWTDGSFFDTFYGVIDGNETMQSYIENILENRKGKAIGIEFGGVGINLFKGFSDGFFKQTIGVSLSDYRTDDGKLKNSNGQRNYKDGRQHNIIIGNLFDTEIYKKIDRVIDNKKVDFIIERMYAGLDNVPSNFLVLITILQKWYKMLNEGGLLLVETPDFAVSVVREWVKILQSEEFLDVAFDEFRRALRIHKLEKAPAKLPVLKMDEVKNILNNNGEI